MKLLLAVALGGALGATARYLVVSQVLRLVGGGFPLGTLVVNVLGSFVLGVLVALMTLKWPMGETFRGFLVVGVLGGFTTFSAFSLDTVLLVERGHLPAAAVYVLATVILSVGGLFAGLTACRQLLT